MSTLSEAVASLQRAGYTGNWFATAERTLRCSECAKDADPATVSVDQTLRFEGQSDPDDEVILFALTEPGGRHGLYSTAYGPAMAAEDADVVRLLGRQAARPGEGDLPGAEG